ncbi:MAG: MarR family winged helix-turn-helix transcriptional regulator [Gammaproteobacteria bacterium]|nr:winged helix-turn-helix transcriptional regulator [Pseudomonadales bacterium]MCP5329520.1 winged helix-turn-helix transcriptional regulator [Pseudomonadales bacterium]
MHPNKVPCYAFNARHASRHLTQFYDHTLAPSGVRVTQLILLNVLKLKGPLAINALAKSLEMDRTTLGRNLQPLERDGLLEMVRSQEDKRRKDVRLTPVGEQKLEHAMTLWHEAQLRFEEHFGVERAQRLLEELRAAAAAVEL